MPIDAFFNLSAASDLIREIASSSVWTSAVRGGVDDGTRLTWDPRLRRTSRIMIPIDVQAFVVPVEGGEPTISITGGADDPAPFAEGAVRPTGVHLHWAMPDAMLRAADADAADDFVLPPLPDRWVVLRILYPQALARPFVRGWVIDAIHGTVTPLDGFTGTTETSDQVFEPLDGLIGGGPLWTAAYDASAGRFGLHDPLDDLPQLREIAVDGFANDAATYVVAGWMTDSDEDPLESRSADELDDILEDLNWAVDHEADLNHLDVNFASEQRLTATAAYARPQTSPGVEIVTPDRTEIYDFEDLAPRQALPVSEAEKVVISQRSRQFASLFHGMVAGVPIDGSLVGGDDRPTTGALEVAVAMDTDDVVSAFWSTSLGADDAERQAIEQLAAAFVGGTLHKLGTDDGLRDIEEREHADGFFALPGQPLPNAQLDVLRQTDALSNSPFNVGRKGRAVQTPAFGTAAERFELNDGAFATTNVAFGDLQNAFGQSGGAFLRADSAASGKVASSVSEIKILSNPDAPLAPAPRLADAAFAAVPTGAESRTAERPAPRMFRPAAPVIAIRGARPSLRHHGDGLYDDQGRLRCRFESEITTVIENIADASTVLPTLGSGALPIEVLTVAQEAMLLTPWASRWLVEAVNPEGDDAVIELAGTRIFAEMLRLFSADGRYDGSGSITISTAPRNSRGRQPRAAAIDSWGSISLADHLVAQQTASELARFSAISGSPPSPVGVTAWRQPWVPLLLEWRVEVTGTESLEGWELDGLDLEPNGAPDTDGRSFNFVGRSPVGRGMTHALHSSLRGWLSEETGRDADLTADQLEDLQQLEGFLAPLDVASASLDGIREQLLGIDFVGLIASSEGEDDRPVASRMPSPLFGGSIRITEMRLVDAFGRTLDVPVANLRTPSNLEIEGSASSLRMRPRLQHGSRWLLRLVDPAWMGEPAQAPEAFVNQINPTLAVNPVSGFLLPDHIDEALEAFDVAGNPLGQLSHHEITGSVRWEPAPGRPVPPGAGPRAGIVDEQPSALPIADIASGVVRADIVQRNAGTGLAGASDGAQTTESSLSAMLRTIDSTLWSVDTFGALGSPSVAGLVGRPIAVVRANLTLDVPSDVGEVRITAPGGENERQDAFDNVRDIAFPVRLGDIQRSDDSLLGYFVDDDYDTFHVIDRSVTSQAVSSGRLRGHLGLLGDVVIPDVEAVDNPYITEDDIIMVRPGTPVKLTLLMLPGGRVHLTSGILPRKRLALQNEWISALPRIMPSVRVGPVLVDPAEIRLPKVNLLGDKQQFTRRTGPLTWRDDPIVSASQSALLPRTPHEIQEGWIRIIEEEADA